MQVEAIYHQGQLQFTTPLRFNRERFKLIVEIPDQEIADSPAGTSVQSNLSDTLDAIIGKTFREEN